jgi:hypothetical protein
VSDGPSVLSFHYGGHHAYARVGYVPDSRRYRLEYFDRQRQTLELRDRTISGYTLEAGGRPMWFEFDVPTLEKMTSVYDKAQRLAVSAEGGTSNQGRTAKGGPRVPRE